MAKESIKFTRAELYDKIWSTPAIELAEEFGISGRGLGKDVRPVQYSGAPARLLGETAMGKPIPKTPLPSPTPNSHDEIRIEPSPAAAEEKIPEAVRAEVETVIEKGGLIRVPETLSTSIWALIGCRDPSETAAGIDTFPLNSLRSGIGNYYRKAGKFPAGSGN